MPSKALEVDTFDRNDVISFWHAIYQASEGFESRIGWTGNYTTLAGTTSEVFVRDVERRVNYYRAMAGIPADIAMNTGATVNIFASDALANRPDASTTKTLASQEAAYMVAKARMAGSGINHSPGPSTPGWTTAAWNGVARGNFTYGYFGPNAVNAYMREYESGNAATSSWNETVGHRRWIISSRATDFATGDIPGEFVYPSTIRYSTNSLYVIQKANELAASPGRFVPFPSAGYFPAPLNSPFWSLGFPGGDFYNAVVSMEDENGNPVPTTIVTQNATAMGRGDPSVVWRVDHAAAIATSIDQDRTFFVKVTNIGGTGVPSEFEYSVTLINPNRLDSDQSLSGSSGVPSSGSANYAFTRPQSSDAVQVNAFSNSTSPWTEDAEYVILPATVINRTRGSYPLLTGPIQGYGAISGNKTFRLTHPVSYDLDVNGVPDETFEINREILSANASSTFNFNYKMGYMLGASTLAVEYSQNDGATWQQLGALVNGVGTNSMSPNNLVIPWSASLPVSSIPYRFRFRYYKNNINGATYNHQNPNHTALPTGIFIDDIRATNCTWLDLKKTNDILPGEDVFSLNAETAGLVGEIPNDTQLHLRMRTNLGGKWFTYGPTKVVTATSTPVPGFDGWLEYEYPGLTGGFTGDHSGDGIPNGVKFGFMLNPLVRSNSRDVINISPGLARNPSGPTISISRAANGIRPQVSAEWSDTMADGSWSSEGVSISYSEESQTATATAPAEAGKRFLRWKVTAQ